eukprot:s1201_g9.t1
MMLYDSAWHISLPACRWAKRFVAWGAHQSSDALHHFAMDEPSLDLFDARLSCPRCQKTGAFYAVLRDSWALPRAGGNMGHMRKDTGKCILAECPSCSEQWQQEGVSRGAAVCVSSQAGCPLDCRFCDSGKVKPAANLPSWAILAQIWAARESYPVQRVVFMGMGEPLLNYSEVSSAIRHLHEDNIFSRPWAITVSTVGVAPKIRSLAHDHPKVALAVSLHAPSQALRQQLLPGSAARWPLETVMEAVTYHQQAVGRVPMFAYTLLPGVNDSEEHAKQLVELLQRTPGSPRSFINLIHQHEHVLNDGSNKASDRSVPIVPVVLFLPMSCLTP